MPLHRRSIF